MQLAFVESLSLQRDGQGRLSPTKLSSAYWTVSWSSLRFSPSILCIQLSTCLRNGREPTQTRRKHLLSQL